MGPQDHAEPTAAGETATLLVSFELSGKSWVLTLLPPQRRKPSRVTGNRPANRAFP
jgi:hypothetical protein